MPTNRTDAVDAYIAGLDHPLRDTIADLRLAILAADPGITEQIKWNAPSFRFGGDDRATFRLQPRGQLQVVLHRGVRVRDSAGFTFPDPDGLLTWAAPDRAVLQLSGRDDLATRLLAVPPLVLRWMRATTDDPGR